VAGKRHRVLIVDDESQICGLLVRLLPEERYDAAAVQSSAEALRLLQEEEFDLVISDIRMPDLDGVGLLRAVRQRYLDVPVILITGAPDVRSAVQAVEFGAMRYLEKPVDAAEFRAVVDRAVNLHELARLKRKSLSLLGLDSTGASDPAGRHEQFRHALDSLYMVYQPIVVPHDGSIFAHEALVRSESPILPNPHALFHAAEQLGMVWDLGRSIRERVARAIGSVDGPVFVNLHPKDFDDEQLYASHDPLAPWASRVVFEVTERTRLDTIEHLEGRIQRLRTAGYRIAVDDLGAGYSSLSSLVQLDPHFVKFDMSLVRDVDRLEAKRRLVGSMLQICRDLGMVVVCEGIEREGERDTLVALGAGLLQGYLYGLPARVPVSRGVALTVDAPDSK
jgi:EAL domain-containing protein (putative c-di-GMP-specific phosphodiesterase class I)